MPDRLLSQYQTVFAIWEHMKVRLLTLIYCGAYDWPTYIDIQSTTFLSEPQKLSRGFFVTFFFIKNSMWIHTNKLFRNMPFSCINMRFIPFSTIVSIYTAINDKVPTLAHRFRNASGFLHFCIIINKVHLCPSSRALTASSWDIMTVNTR